jgi:hypothetical protein
VRELAKSGQLSRLQRRIAAITRFLTPGTGALTFYGGELYGWLGNKNLAGCEKLQFVLIVSINSSILVIF